MQCGLDKTRMSKVTQNKNEAILYRMEDELDLTVEIFLHKWLMDMPLEQLHSS
jgi:hypothetical protein